MLQFAVRRLAAGLLATAALATGAVQLTGQAPPAPAPPMIQSLSEPGEGLNVRSRSDESGLVTFASSQRGGVLLDGLASAPAEGRALAFVDQYGGAFGIASRAAARLLVATPADAVGQEHVRLQQLHDGIPVTAGEMIVHLRGDRVIAVNAHTLANLPVLSAPTLLPATAIDEARAVVEKQRPELAAGARFSQPRLEIFNRGMLDEGAFPTRLAWFVEAHGDALREFIWIDAETGASLLNFSQLPEARNRTVYDVALGTMLPGTLVRSEGGPASPVTDVNQAYDYAGVTYDYFFTQHGRDSFDGAGAEIKSSVRYRHPSQPGVPYQNAFWSGTLRQMVYGEGFAAADDVVGHELTHAVIEYSANLLYYNQSGALNESYADIFGETIDQLSALGGGNDGPAARWVLAEDLAAFPGGIRNMMTPTAFGDPGKLSDPQFVCRSDAWTSPTADLGGVHSNSGVPNHAFALMVDGGAYNGQTIAGIGVLKASLIQYRALTTYLTSGSGFRDNSAALNQSCTDLLGIGGITAGDCTQVATAILAVEMANPLSCTGATPPPATFCPLGGNPVPLFADGFESGGGNWGVSSTSAANWGLINDFAKNGRIAGYGVDANVISDHRIAMNSAVAIPPNARMAFDHAFEFEHIGTSFFYDGGVIEYSTNNGTTWTDAGGLIDAGQAYNGTLDPTNALGARTAFARSSFGYTGSRLNLATLAGQSVRFRFRVGTDPSVGSLGWAIDNIVIYTCSGVTTGPLPPTGFAATSIVGNQVTFNWTPPVGGSPPTGYLIAGGVTPGSVDASVQTGSTFPGFSLQAPTGSFYVRVYTLSGASLSAASNEIQIHVNVPVPPSAPANLLGMVSGNTIALAWKNTFAGGAPTNIVLDVAGSINTSIPLGLTEGFQFAPVPPGTYTLSVRGVNVAGSGPPSSSVTLTFPGACSGVPLTPTNFLTSKVGNTIFVSWDLPASGPAPTIYVLQVSGSFIGSIPTPTRALSGTVGPGVYNISVFAANACGNGVATPVQTVTIP
jgi:bacillolysin